ncbi:MAG: methionine--tRNA ligase [Candidatus Blackburnbacteria bacterium RIFCSPHIGHO2_02_FULL_39_13]|uniref:Methionine--tRNA ligase n=1 Tax=Candidatus Blackburnbacteria bacterium RIFCSPLOWO2_01_FULL_40_20 TaxID=1797519 RepID=A0A1G1VEV9_9BACT|nr:MAG: Methionyl-tRNA synthetase [Microgenomates group bacterium GW2011_GWA2_39_19]OGY07254.1 MAG: methionine--tRNA ligase [Candidatus Blackburnbacteria bacterium RIFCSPHIGHO2_01_FULL_40_17]OGY09274.1 MAG: methionine--tRNA ligase [Candidatus Blackburnbacteria bacterium RIFCSPHIGHO2_02_FULL_39_13]OGY13899.1 MAG: methionine--tRNA ligase [Candidatus Blackburnbacteria bacterium RIFCSPLOWO2_01_FULL_40_20]HBL51698.1 methionine--tRNA ligase [Candidatus Blackburnbacteria bacterium]
MNKFYITTAIDYTNDVIHIGHAYQKILSDALARYHRLIGDKTYFLTGTDEHGQKVEKAAKAEGIEPKAFTDRIAAADQAEWDTLNISYDRFIRTTDEDHKKFVQEFWLKVKSAGDIYPEKYEGLYCESCESYLDESELINGKCPFHPTKEPQKIQEENYFFRLSKYQEFLEKYIEENKDFVIPENKRKEILTFVKSGLKDFSISRQNVKWGIPVPDDPKHTIYVWFDALLNYLTYGVEKNCWPADVHVLGKDNLRFHSVYWPAMLKSAGYELPKTVFVHDFISLNGQKISKSLGNIIRPKELVDQFGIDGVRYFFLRFGPLASDIDISFDRIKEVYNSDLANGLGNLVARVSKLCQNSKLEFVAPEITIENFPEYNKLLENFQVNTALDFVWEIISQADKYIENHRPWELSGNDLKEVLTKLVEEIRKISLLLNPFLPETAKKIEQQFKGPKVKSELSLFPRLS